MHFYQRKHGLFEHSRIIQSVIFMVSKVFVHLTHLKYETWVVLAYKDYTVCLFMVSKVFVHLTNLKYETWFVLAYKDYTVCLFMESKVFVYLTHLKLRQISEIFAWLEYLIKKYI